MISAQKLFIRIIIGMTLITCFIYLLLHTLNNISYVACKTKDSISDKISFIMETDIAYNKTPHITTIENMNIYTSDIGNSMSYGITFICIMLICFAIAINMMNIKPAIASFVIIISVSMLCFSIILNKLSFNMNKICIATMNNELMRSNTTYLECSCVPKLSFDKSIVSCACSPTFIRNLYILKLHNDMG